MNSSIYYFSGTGNSLYVARQIAEKLSGELIPIAKAIKSDEIRGDHMGIVFPIYMYNAPRIVYEFVKKIKSCDYLFIVMTMGGNSGKTTKRIRSFLNKNNIKLSAGFSVRMPDNYIVWSGAMEEKKQQELFLKADSKISQIVERTKNKDEHFDDEKDFDLSPDEALPFPISIMPQWVLQLLFDMGFKRIPQMDGPFVVNEKCNSCEICKKICPVNNIEIVDGKPVWNHQCEQCLACIQWCPKEAIEYGEKTIGRKRYHQPEVSLKDMFL